MRIKPFKDQDSVLHFIIFFGVLLDTYSSFGLWRSLHNVDQLNIMLQQYGLGGTELGLDSIIAQVQSTLGSALVIFILWDYVAFYFFWHYKNWARKYILSIGVFYLIGCFFDFNFLQFFYGLITVYYLFGKQARKEFFPYPRRRPFDL